MPSDKLETFTLMVQGTTSDAGKSTLVCALGRLLQQRGVACVPFKPQNMALNSAVTDDGGEIGRAQALQAQACGLRPHTDMNPVLLKPSSDMGAQVIIQGQAIGHLSALDYHDYKQTAMHAVLDSYQRLSHQYPWVLVEGAGSPAEVNLRANDIANMGFAEAVDCPVILIADIDRGGVFAHLIGTLACLSQREQDRILGFVINRFRGDIALLQDGLDWLEAKTNKPVLGVLPYLKGLYLDAEDAIASEHVAAQTGHRLRVVVPVYPRLSNHTDFDRLRLHPQVELILIGPEQTPPAADLVILAGSKNTRAGLHWLMTSSGQWSTYLQRHLRYGGKILGICGGLQMLGEVIHDPLGLEGDAGSMTGLQLLPLTTTLATDKTLRQQQGVLSLPHQAPCAISGYEIHHGQSHIDTQLTVVMHDLQQQAHGWINDDQSIMVSYWHGLLDHPDALHALLGWAGLSKAQSLDTAQVREQQLDRLAASTQAHLDWPRLERMVQAFYHARHDAP